MSLDAGTAVADYESPALAAVDDPRARPWFLSRRFAVAIVIVGALVVEATWIAKRRDPLAGEREAVAALPETERAELANRWDRFQKLGPEEQRRLRELHVAIEQDAKPDELRAALVSYETWKSDLSPQQTAGLVGLTAEARLDRVREIAAEQTALDDRTLSAADAEKLVAWMEKQIETQRDKILKQLPEAARLRFDSFNVRDKVMSLMLAAATHRTPNNQRLEFIPPEAWADLRSQLSPKAQRAWDGAKSPEARRQLVSEWINQSFGRTMQGQDGMMPPRVSDEQLRKFFDDELTDAERNRLVALPKDEMVAQLRQQYFRRKGLMREPTFGMPNSGEPRRNDGPPGMGQPMFGPPFGRKPQPPDDGRPRRDGRFGPPNSNRPPEGERPAGPPPAKPAN